MLEDNAKHNITRTLHWLMALLVIGLIALGFYMATTESYHLYDLHKSLGVLALILLVFRLIWRTIKPWQSSAKNKSQEGLVQMAHRMLLILLLLMPVSGFSISGFGGHGVAFFGLQIIPSNYNESGEAIPFNKTLTEVGYFSHELVAYLFSFLIVIHVAAAMKHHLVDKDNTLKRMLAFSR